MKNDLTLRKLKNTNFGNLYNRFIVGSEMNSNEYECLLALAVCFTNADDTYVQQLGYRIIVEYCNQTGSYLPLYEISINKGLYPVSEFIEEHHINDEKRNFFTEWNTAFMQQYSDNGIFKSKEQSMMGNFFKNREMKTVSVIAPTSYGKSDLILNAVKQYRGKKICIITSTKALLLQTKQRIQKASKEYFPKIVIHPEMYNPSESSLLAVLTQERLLRVLKKDPSLKFDCIIVDEAHEILEDNARSHTLANVIIVAQKRNPDISFKFLTPFLMDENNLKIRYTTFDIDGFKVTEYIKTEKYYLCDIRNQEGLSCYDQFLDEFIAIPSDVKYTTEETVIKKYASNKNIIYLNKPSDIEKFALALANVLPDIKSETITNACNNIKEYLNPDYNLLSCLKKGIIYHHGSVPDAIRVYIENLYKNEESIRFIITSSTLLSGVNLPAESIFLLDNKRGRPNLSRDSFLNLVGRACRFNEIFNKEKGNLKLLEPKVYVVFGNYFSKNANAKNFLKSVAQIEKKFEDKVDNVLLANSSINSDNEEKLKEASEYIENYENGIIEDFDGKYAQTNVGKACIMNGVNEFDVFKYESEIQQIVDGFHEKQVVINNTKVLLDEIATMFIKNIPEKSGISNKNLRRLDNEKARNFYSMFLDWKIKNKSYAEMINLVIDYWKGLLNENKDVEIYVGRWGDIKHNKENSAYYTKLSGKTRTQVINLAIVRIKEEQDFIDNMLIKYVEVLNDLDLLDEKLYSEIKYGTDNEILICLLKNGLSLNCAKLLLKDFKNHLSINIMNSTVQADEALINQMRSSGVNEIIIQEIQSCL